MELIFGEAKRKKRAKDAEKITNNLRKHKLLKPLKSLAIIWILCIFISFFIYTNLTKITLNDSICSFGPHLKIIGICYYANVPKEEKKNTNTTLTKLLWKRILSNKQNFNYDMISVDMLRSEIQWFGWDLSMMRISYKLTKRSTKAEKVQISLKILELFNIINFIRMLAINWLLRLTLFFH